MAHKRMFCKEVTGSDAFMEMPPSSQALYFHLGMEADDDGFVGNPKRLLKILGTSEDDMKILVGKRFVLLFNSGVVVIKHHRMNNNWDSHNCKRTPYLEEFSQIYIKDNNAYTLDPQQGIPVQTATRLQPVFRIDKNRIDNTLDVEAPTSVRSYSKDEDDHAVGVRTDRRVRDKEAAFAVFSKSLQPWMHHKQQRLAALRLFDRGLDKLVLGKEIMKEHETDQMCPQADTPWEYEAKLPKLNRFIKKNGL